tara:strand:+ start:83 stop:523 length:441 start_codon:yes stop_codon:yes gene_type:complete
MVSYLSGYIKIKYILSISISILLILQIYIIYLNNMKSEKNFDSSSSLDNFETILYNKNGNNVIKAEKLIYINKSKTILKGQSSLTNEDYEILSEDIIINFDTGDAKSDNDTYFINNEMEVTSEGFEYQSSNKMIKFFENTKILFND